MRLGLILLLLLFVIAGTVFGALNGDRVTFDFYFASVEWPKGAALLAALALGWLGGGLFVYVALVPRLARRVRALTRELERRDAADRP